MFVSPLDICAGWRTWSLAHNLGHRWWHNDMKRGVETFYAHGELRHHRMYDRHTDQAFHRAEDPGEVFISFPFLVGPVALLFVLAYGWLRGWDHALPYATGMYFFMLLDRRLQILFHRSSSLPGILGWFQKMHRVHHTTHANNCFFVSGLIRGVLLGSVLTPGNALRARSATASTLR